jgi:hypothetical protein
MPSRNVVFHARYRAAAAWAPISETLVAGVGGAVTFHRHVPLAPRGLILLLHGRGGSAGALFSRTESRAFTVDAVARGLGVVALDSHDRTANEWNQEADLASNLDLRNVRAVLDLLLARGEITRGAPLFTFGVSAGSFFSAKVVGLLTGAVTGFTDFRAASLYIGQGGPPSLVASLVTPLRFNLAQNDSHPDISNAAALAQSAAQNARGVPSEAAVHPPSPLYPGRFARIEGLSVADSTAIFEALRDAGLLDPVGYQLVAPSQSGWLARIPSRFSAFAIPIAEQLNVAYAEHQFFSDYNNATLGFFERRL